MKITGLLVLITALYSFTYGDFDAAFKTECARKESGFVKIKSHPICIEDYDDMDKNTFKVYLTAGQRYKLNLCDANKEGEKMMVFLLDKNDRELASNFSPKGQLTQQLEFKCKQTGTYYLQFQFQNKAKGCGLAVLMLNTLGQSKDNL